MIKTPAVGFKLGSVWEDKGYTKVSRIFISYQSSKVCALQFQLVHQDGSLVLSPLHGIDDSATSFFTINLDVQNECVTGLSGYGDAWKECLLGLIITTNIRNYGPFGKATSLYVHKFDVQLGDNELFGGFHGTMSRTLGLTSVDLFVKLRDRLPLVSSSGQVKKEPN